MKVLGIGKHIGKHEDHQDMHPPAGFIHHTDAPGRDPRQNSGKQGAHRVDPGNSPGGGCVGFQVGHVHAKQRDHQDQDHAEGDVGVHVRDGLHFNAFKSPDMKKQPACQENHDADGDYQPEDIPGGNDQAINRSEKFQNPFGPEKAVDDHFDTADGDYAKTPENKCM